MSLIVCLAKAGASAQVVNVSNPEADAFMRSAQPNSNFGGAGALAVAAQGLPDGAFQSVLRFDTAAAKAAFDAAYGPGQWSIQSVALRLSAAFPNNPIFNNPAGGQFSASWMQNDSWEEGFGGPSNPSGEGITFATLPSFLTPNDEVLGTYNYTGATSGSFTYNLGLMPGFTLDAASGGLLSLRLYAANTTISYVFRSRSYGTESLRPRLTITAVPEPAVGILVLIGLIVIRRRLLTCSPKS